MLDQIIPVLVDDGYRSVAQGGHTTAFERRHVVGWTILVAIVFFPVGLIALLFRGRESVTVIGGERSFEVHGCCGKHMADYLMAVADDAAAAFADGASRW